MSRYPGIIGQVGWAVRRPGAAIGLLRDRPLWLAMTALVGLPRSVRFVLARPIERVARLAVHRQGDHPVATPSLMVALVALDRTRDAAAVADRAMHTASPMTATRLARIALAIEEPLVADRLLEPHRAALADDPAFDGLRGEIAQRMGRYAEAEDLLERAARRRAHDPGLRRALDRVRGERALLDEAWRPVLPNATPGRASPATTPIQSGRILHLLTNSLPYRHAGYSVRAQQVAHCQQAIGLDPIMVTRAGFPGSDGVVGAARVDEVDGVMYHRLRPALEPGLPIDRVAQETAAGLIDLVAELRPAVLQPTTNYVNAQVAFAVRDRIGLPVVYEVRGFLEETWRSRMGDRVESGERYAGARAMETACMRRADAVVTLSETMRDDILARGGIDPAAVVVIPNAVDVERFMPGPRDGALAASLGIEADETVIGYISSLVSYEGIGYLIDAVAQLRRRGRRVRLLLVGDGDARAELGVHAMQAGLVADGTAIFTGRVAHAEVERYYRMIDVFVVPRTDDRVSRLVTPLKPYEAMSMARAVVVSAVPALLEIVRDGETGRSFMPEDTTSLADVLDELVDDPDQRRRLGEAARTWVAAERTWAQNGQRYLALYRRLGVA